MLHRLLTRLAAVAAVAFLAACGGSDDEPAPRTVVERAQADPRLSVLAEAVAAADLAPALSGTGPFTVFAPTDDAFAALLAELGLTKAQLLADKPLLQAVLQYHVLPARVTRAEVPVGKAVAPLQGGVFKIDAGGGGTLVVTDGRNRSATVVAPDVPASNGVVHVIDRVLLPADKTILQTAQALPDFGLLVQAVEAAGLAPALAAPGPLTVFAPTNAAFTALLAELGVSLDALLADTSLLREVLLYHLVDGRVLKADVPVGAPVTTLQGQSFTVDASLAITDQRARTASIVATDVLASNGVVHVVDRVLLPRP